MTDITAPAAKPADGRIAPVDHQRTPVAPGDHQWARVAPVDHECARVAPADHLRAFVTVLVVAHHAVLAYNPYAPPAAAFAAPPYAWRAFPIVDAARWPGIELIVLLNDTFFMALMFFVGGLFVRPALARHGAAGYARERALRLGVPFVVACAVLAPLAYLPAWLASGGAPDLASYARAWLALPMWPAGPAWFLWLLLAFGLVAAVAYRARPAWFARLGERGAHWAERPSRLFGALVVAGALAYVPLAQVYDPTAWFAFGPFAAQTGRIGLYFVYFAIGAAVGADRLFDRAGPLARQWWRWQCIAPVAFGVFLALLIALFTQIGQGRYDATLAFATNLAFVTTGAATSLAVVAAFARGMHGRGKAWRSLDRNAYGIYLVHYACVTWLQFALLDVPWSGAAKAAIVIVAAFASSWALAAALRRIPAVARVV